MKANHSPELRTKLLETNLLNFNHMTTDQLQHRKLELLTTDHHLIASQITKAVSSYFTNLV